MYRAKNNNKTDNTVCTTNNNNMKISPFRGVVFESLTLKTMVFATPIGAVPAADHPRLHVGSLNEFPRLISGTRIESAVGLNTEILERFSMERYTDGLPGIFIEQTNHETTGGS